MKKSDTSTFFWVVLILVLAVAATYVGNQNRQQQVTGFQVAGGDDNCCSCPADKTITQEGEGSGTTLEAGLKACCADAGSKKTDSTGACAAYCISPPDGCGCCKPTDEGSTEKACAMTKINDVGMDDLTIDFDKGTITQKSTGKEIAKTDTGKKKINCNLEFKCGCECDCEERLKQQTRRD